MLAEFIQLPKPGETIGVYQLDALVSSSVLANFYTATQRLTGERCLVMVLPEALLKVDSRFRKRFEEAAAGQRKLPEESPAMAARDVTAVGGNLVVQYAKGEFRSLTTVVGGGKPLPLDAGTAALRRIAEGLSDAHEIGQGHCFLTPDFIFFDANGQVFIAGVGLFPAISYESFERYASGAIMPVQLDKQKTFSALEILSPEIRNYRSKDPRSELYGLGMSAYYMLIGFKPVRNWVLPSQARPELGEQWDLLLSRCLAPAPADRFPHLRALIKELDALEERRERTTPSGNRAMRALTRIPLPKALEERLGMRAILMLRLGMLVVAGSLAVFSASLLRFILVTDLEVPASDQPIVHVANADRANLVLNVAPAGAKVGFIGRTDRPMDTTGEPLWLLAPQGPLEIMVNAPRHDSRRFRVNVERNQRVERTVRLRPAFGELRISGRAETEVWHRGIMDDAAVFLGRLDGEGELLLADRLLEGSHLLEFRHPISRTAQLEIDIRSAATTDLALEQPALLASLFIESEPAGAAVFLGDERLGQTPLQLDDVEPLVEHRLRLELANHHPYAADISFAPGEVVRYPLVSLRPRTGTAVLEVRWPDGINPPESGIEVSVDGEPSTIAAGTVVTLPIGERGLEVSHPNFFPIRASFTVEEGVKKVLAVTMQPRPASLEIVLDPEPAVFAYRVDGRVVTPDSAGVLPLAPAKDTIVEIIARDFLPVQRSFHAAPNQREQWQVRLQPLPGPQAEEAWTVPYLELPMAWIAPGDFMMGSPVTEYRRTPNEDNRTAVRITRGFWIATTEITQRQYQRIMGDNPSNYPGDSHPVDSVSWELAVEFCERLTDAERAAQRLPDGWVYRLPTEAEWEYAARAGSDTAFSIGPSASALDGNFHGAYLGDPPPEAFNRDQYGSMPVASFPANAWGLFDVHGNVAEWTLDRYWDRHPGGFVRDPFNDERGRGRTVRGGSWRDSADRARSAARADAAQNLGRSAIGFRIVLAPPS
jgi:formylglycine-generating enzyme required for sulfatase activity